MDPLETRPKSHPIIAGLLILTIALFIIFGTINRSFIAEAITNTIEIGRNESLQQNITSILNAICNTSASW